MFNETSEYFMRVARQALAAARDYEASPVPWLASSLVQPRPNIEAADACGAIAANKIAQAIRVDERIG